jgi:hypothetical protein
MIALCNIFLITRRSRRLDTTEITTLSRTTMQDDAVQQLQLQLQRLHAKLLSAVLLSSHMAYQLHLPVTVTLHKMLSKRRSLPHQCFCYKFQCRLRGSNGRLLRRTIVEALELMQREVMCIRGGV